MDHNICWEIDAGKSNVLRALNLFFNDETDPGERFNPQRDFHKDARAGQGKAKEIEITLIVNLPDGFKRQGRSDQVMWKRVWREGGAYRQGDARHLLDKSTIDGRSKIPTLLDRMRFTYVPAIKDKAFFGDLQGRIYDVLQRVQGNTLNNSAGTFENQIGTQIKELLSALNEEFDDVVTMRMPENLRPIFETMELNGGDIPFSRRGDGIKIRHIPQMLKFIADQLDLTVRGPGVIGFSHIWGFEEPENNVEMSACFKMEKWFRALIQDHDHHQLFLTTHSPVFYKIEDDGLADGGDPWVIRYFLEKAKDHTKFSTVSADHADSTMGLMPLVAPFVYHAKKKYDDMEGELGKARNIAASKIPALFVEGKTDKIIVENCIKLFAPNRFENIIIVSGEDGYGSANAIASRSLAWLLTMRHRNAADRVKAFALFDNDDAGKAAKKKLSEDADAVGLQLNGQFFTTYLLEALPHIRPFLAKGFRIQIDLESMYPLEIWREAHSKEWLEKIEPTKILSEKMVNALVNRGVDPFKGIKSDDIFFIKHRFTDDGKVKVTNYIKGLSDAKKRILLAGFEPLINRIEHALF